MIRKSFLFIILLLTGFAPALALQPQFNFTKLGIKQGLSKIPVHSIAQDHDGFLWFGTSDGLNRYDGYNVSVFRINSTELATTSSLVVTQPLVDHNNQLWLATDKGLFIFNRDSEQIISADQFYPQLQALSELYITSMFMDNKSNLFIGTYKNGLYQYQIKPNKLTPIQLTTEIEPSKQHITVIQQGQEQQILIGTNDGLYQLSAQQDHAKAHQANVRLSHGYVKAITSDKSGNLWVGTLQGLNFIDQNGRVTHYLSSQKKRSSDKDRSSESNQNHLSDNRITSLLYSESGELWIGTFSGINIFDPQSESFIHLQYQRSNWQSLNGNTIMTLFQDRTRSIWVSTAEAGLNKYNPYSRQLGHFISSSNTAPCLSGNTIYAMAQGKANDIWIAANGSGLHRVPWPLSQHSKCDWYHESSQQPEYRIPDNEILSLLEDSYQKLWIGSRKGLSIIDLQSKKHSFRPKIGDAGQGRFINNVNAMVESPRGDIWFATLLGLYRYDRAQDNIEAYMSPNSHAEPFAGMDIFNIKFDGQGHLWLGTSQHGVIKLNVESGQQTLLNRFLPKNKQISAVTSLWLNQKAQLWVGTETQGIYVFNRNNYELEKHFTRQNGLNSQSIYRLFQDKQGDTWFSTGGSGIGHIDVHHHIRHYSEHAGAQHLEFNTAGFYDSNKSIIFFAGINGFNAFKPSQLKHPVLSPQVAMTDFKIFDHSTPAGPRQSFKVLPKNLMTTQKITLDYSARAFSFQFAGLHYISPENNRYAYRLDGFDPGWNHTDASQRIATYTNLEPGSYQFMVKAAAPLSQWSQSQSIQIDILPPWWLTWWAKTLYVLIILTSLLLFYQLRTSAIKKRARDLEDTVRSRTRELEIEKSRVEQLLNDKNNDFINMSHEFRTPLTLILGPLNKLINQSKQMATTESISHLNIPLQSIQLMKRNSDRLLHMVDQLLHIEQSRISSIAQQVPQNISKLLADVAQSFTTLAEEKQLNLQINILKDIWLLVTPDSIEKISLNLISNAIKYTDAGDTVTIELSKNSQDKVVLAVSDTGLGIAKDQQSIIFDRFQRLKHEKQAQISGAGVGLALVKELVRANQASITVESELDQGSCFYVIFNQQIIQSPVVNHDKLGQPQVNTTLIQQQLANLIDAQKQEHQVKNKDVTHTHTIVVIEDNPDMTQYILESLPPHYKCITATDGEQGCQFAAQYIPDLVISDIMMPQKDGYQVCEFIKGNNATSHIPVILLTARNDKDSRLKGWKYQADEFLSKPFDEQELLLRIENLLRSRQLLQQRFYQHTFELSTKTQSEVDGKAEALWQQQENKFIKKFDAILANYYEDPELRIAQIANELAMSERQLFRKMKGILQITPADYIRSYRLEKAACLLKQGTAAGNVAYSVGFSTHTYFSRCFKAKYGCPPSQYVKGAKKTVSRT